jgi:hypothetical protein
MGKPVETPSLFKTSLLPFLNRWSQEIWCQRRDLIFGEFSTLNLDGRFKGFGYLHPTELLVTIPDSIKECQEKTGMLTFRSTVSRSGKQVAPHRFNLSFKR